MPSLDPRGEIITDASPGAFVVRLTGEIDGALRDQASAALSRVLTQEAPVVLDTADVRFIDSAGVAFLMQCAASARDLGLPVSLPTPARCVADVLAALGVQELFGSAAPVIALRQRGGRD